MSELKPCPFCGGEAARDIILEDGSNYGGEIIGCKRCLASTRVFFGEKEGLEESWNTRTPAPAEVERLVDRINDELFCGALKRETKSRLLAALPQPVPVEELEAGKEYDMTIRVKIDAGPHIFAVLPNGERFYIPTWLRHSAGAAFRKAGE